MGQDFDYLQLLASGTKISILDYKFFKNILALFTLLIYYFSKSGTVWFQVIPSENELYSLGPCLEVKHLIMKTAMHDNELHGVKFLFRSFHCLETLTIDINPDLRILEVSTLYKFL